MPRRTRGSKISTEKEQECEPMDDKTISESEAEDSTEENCSEMETSTDESSVEVRNYYESICT